MPNRLIFVRHGIRGVKAVESRSVNYLPLFNIDNNLSLFGHIYSYKQGQFIYQQFGRPTFIYADITDERTVATAIAIAKGCDQNQIWLCNAQKDMYFKQRIHVTKESKMHGERILRANKTKIEKIKKMVEKSLPYIHLQNRSGIDQNGQTVGLIKQLAILVQIPTFAILSNIHTPLIEIRGMVEQTYPVNYLVKNPTIETIREAAENLLNGIFFLLLNNQLSILVGHDTNISNMSQYLKQPYLVDDHPEFYVPPNSGFVFTLEQTSIRIEYIDLNWDPYIQ